MLTSSRVLGAALLLLPLLAACDRHNPLNPGVHDQTNNDSFAEAPPATRVDTDRDSISGGGRAYTPVGTGSMARSTAEAISTQPGGDPNTSKFTESGTTDGSSTTSGRSLTNRGRTDSEVPGTTRGTTGGSNSQGRGTLGNIPRETNQNAASKQEGGQSTQRKDQPRSNGQN